MRVLVLGARGQLGSEVKDQLYNRVPVHINSHLTVVEAARSDVDVSDFVALRAFLKDQQPDWIINASAFTAVDAAEAESTLAYAINEGAVSCMAEYCRDHGSNLVHVSTDYVFSGEGDTPFSEEDAVSPLGVYGKSKLAGEQGIASTLSRHIMLRTSWVFGIHGKNFVKTMLSLASNRSEVRVVGDQVGAPTSAKGIARAIAEIIFVLNGAHDNDPRWGTYHFSGAPYVSWAAFAQQVFDAALELGLIATTPKVTAITTEEYPTPARRPNNSRLDCAKIGRTFNVSADDWRDALRQMLLEMKGSSHL